ncbi:MAG: hypothetical protein P4L67_05225 [Candidatus Pacebacteria bacterium]|nr:hypothetical protein [Candidatus Paceibacterota bacterium]
MTTGITKAALDQLPPFEAWVIKRRLVDKENSWRRLESECGLAVYRLKQIEREALLKLFNPEGQV